MNRLFENRGNGQETTSLEVQALLSQVSPKIMDALFGGKEELAKRGFNMDVATNGTIASAYSQYANGKKLRLPNSIARVEPGFLINENGDSVLNKDDEDFDFKKQKVSNTAGEMLRQGKVKLVNKFYPDGKLKRFVSPAGVQIIREKII